MNVVATVIAVRKVLDLEKVSKQHYPLWSFPLSSHGASITWSIAQTVHNNGKLVTTGSQQGLMASVCLREAWPHLPGNCSSLSGYFMASRAHEHWEHWGFAGCIELNHLLGSVYLPHCCSHCVRPQATLCNGPLSQGHCARVPATCHASNTRPNSFPAICDFLSPARGCECECGWRRLLTPSAEKKDSSERIKRINTS